MTIREYINEKAGKIHPALAQDVSVKGLGKMVALGTGLVAGLVAPAYAGDFKEIIRDFSPEANIFQLKKTEQGNEIVFRDMYDFNTVYTSFLDVDGDGKPDSARVISLYKDTEEANIFGTIDNCKFKSNPSESRYNHEGADENLKKDYEGVMNLVGEAWADFYCPLAESIFRRNLKE